MSLPIGMQKLTADGSVGVAGKKIRLYGIIVNSDASGSAVDLHDGTDTNGAKLDTITGAASVSTRVNYAGGLIFSSGLYINLDGTHTAFVTAIYEQENS